jgi:hypothetical protein
MTAVLLWIVRFLVVLVVARMLFRALAGRRTMAPQTRQRIGGTLVRDPQCGTYLPPERALTVTTASGVVHFCSDRCRDAWTSSHA